MFPPPIESRLPRGAAPACAPRSIFPPPIESRALPSVIRFINRFEIGYDFTWISIFIRTD